MLELPLHITKRKFQLDHHISQKFSKPIIFYLGHRNDARNFLITFVLIDFSKQEYTYITSYSLRNTLLVEVSAQERKLRNKAIYNPHCTIVIDPDTDFYTFVENAQYFYYINLQERTMRVLSGSDLNCEDNDSIVCFGSTFYKDDEDDSLFYFTALVKDGHAKDARSKVNVYRSDLHLKNIETVHEMSDFSYVPHVTRKYKNTLFNSNFYFTRYELPHLGKLFENGNELITYVYRSLYEDLCKENGWGPSDDGFLAAISSEQTSSKHAQHFIAYIRRRFGNSDFKQICDSVPEFNFRNLPGSITLVDLPSKQHQTYESTTSNPGHFEIDTMTDTVYVSSHNFVVLDRIYFMGPAAIDKYLLRDGKLIKTGTFQIPDGYRYTTHKVFHYKGKPYLCTFSQPNRLLLIDAETMSLMHYEDIGTDVLSNVVDHVDFLNYSSLEHITLKTIEISDDGEIIFFIGYDGIYFYSLPERKILDRIAYLDSTRLFDEVTLDQFYKRTTHTQFFE